MVAHATIASVDLIYLFGPKHLRSHARDIETIMTLTNEVLREVSVELVEVEEALAHCVHFVYCLRI